MKHKEIRTHNFPRRNTMQGINRGESKKDTKRSRGGGICIGFVSAALLLLVLATGAYADFVCTDCHNPGGVPVPHSDGCRSTNCLQSCHPKDLNTMNHLKGPGTPITDPLATDPLVITGICNTCHNRPFDGVYHPYRINVNAGSLTNPGIVDINDACGQCHGGGDNSTSNPPAPGVPYRTKAELALVANGIHDSSGVYYPVTFSYTVIPNTYTVNVTATVDCGGACPPLEYDWDWGDGSANGTANPDSHTYALAGTKTITLTIKLASNHLNAGSVARTLTLANLDLPPAASNSCVWNANTWTMTVTDTSTDDGPDADALPGDGDSLLKLNVDWGDGSVRSLATGAGAVFSHVYTNPGNYTVTETVTDSMLQPAPAPAMCVATAAYFTISGTVYRSNGTTAVTYATVQLYKGTALQRSVSTGTTGTFSFGSLKPGTYSLKVLKSGYTFANPAWGPTAVGPNATGITINAITP